MIELCSFEPWHIDYIQPRAFFDSDKKMKERIIEVQKNDMNITHSIFRNGKIVAIIGIFSVFERHYQVWSVTTESIKSIAIEFVRLCKWLLEFYQEKLGILRYHVTVDCSIHNGAKLVEVLGFHKEATMVKYGPSGEDHYLYARTF